MPEGPSIVILKEAANPFIGLKIKAATGNSKKIDINSLKGQVITDFKSWGKHFLICFSGYTLRIHFLLFGSYTINQPRVGVNPRLSLQFTRGRSLNFYACSITRLDNPLDEIYDWTADVMNKQWNSRRALKKLRARPDTMVCDAVLDQNIFAGVGNIIKNEVLYRIRVHPESRVGKIPNSKQRELVAELVHYSFQFLEWKQAFTLRKHWLAHTKKTCPRDMSPITKEYLGKTMRRTFYCLTCQRIYC
jgi:endonuclease-8